MAKADGANLLELFLDMLSAERGAAENTLAAYRRDLEALAAALSKRGKTLANATPDDLRAYLTALAKRQLAASSQARALSAMRQLFRFLYAEGHRAEDPAASLQGPKRSRPLPKTISVNAVDRLLQTARTGIDDSDKPLGERVRRARLYCLLELLYATGMRVSELVSLPIGAARQDARMLIVRGKGNKERLVPLNNAAKAATSQYL